MFAFPKAKELFYLFSSRSFSILPFAFISTVHLELSVYSVRWESRFTLFFFFVFCPFRTAPTAYEGSQARGQIGAIAVSLHHSHSNAGSEPFLRPTP